MATAAVAAPRCFAQGANSVAGTTWVFPGDAKTTVHFFPGGRLQYDDFSAPATWVQEGALVSMNVNNVTLFELKVEGEKMTGSWRRLKGEDVGDPPAPSSVTKVAPPAGVPSVAGTTWQFPGEEKSTVEFFHDGRLRFGKLKTPARWQQNGAALTMNVNDFTLYELKIEGDSMTGSWRRLKGEDVDDPPAPSSMTKVAGAFTPSVAGTTWVFPGDDNNNKTYVEFRPDGRAKFSDSASPAKWRQSGTALVFSINDFTEWNMTLAGDAMSGSWHRLKGNTGAAPVPSTMTKVTGRPLAPASLPAAPLPPS